MAAESDRAGSEDLQARCMSSRESDARCTIDRLVGLSLAVAATGGSQTPKRASAGDGQQYTRRTGQRRRMSSTDRGGCARRSSLLDAAEIEEVQMASDWQLYGVSYPAPREPVKGSARNAAIGLAAVGLHIIRVAPNHNCTRAAGRRELAPADRDTTRYCALDWRWLSHILRRRRVPTLHAPRDRPAVAFGVSVYRRLRHPWLPRQAVELRALRHAR
jgi:hypothetical protein